MFPNLGHGISLLTRTALEIYDEMLVTVPQDSLLVKWFGFTYQLHYS